MQAIGSMDVGILQWIAQHMRMPWLTTVMQCITTLGNAGAVWIALSVLLLCFAKTRRAGVAMLCALLLSLVVGEGILKPWVARPRPFIEFTQLQPLIVPPSGFSFPSGHTMSSFAAATACFYFHRKLGLVSLFLAVLIGFSRLYVCVHFPSDVLCGMVLGILVGWVCAYFTQRIANSLHYRRLR